ncbi:MAG TPA: FAD-binding protein [Candidatus Thermoplasmatota archaeon]|nr:FAD-binding protein [Candidatus Thermoplasmatota archaeon]
MADAGAPDLGFATVYDTFAPRGQEPAAHLEDVQGSDWRNILVLGRATPTGIYPETLALVGRARYMADELGCRVEVVLIGENLEAATAALKRYPIDTVYRVRAPDYAPIDHTAKLLEQVVRRRRPELVLVFQSRSGDAVTAYAASRLGVGFATGASRIDIDTAQRKAVVTHESGGHRRFQVVTAMQAYPQFVSVQRGLFRAPLEDPYANVKVHDLKVEAGRVAQVEVLGLQPPPPPTLGTAERVVVAGARIRGPEELGLARELANKLDAAFGITTGIVERGLATDEGNVVGVHDHRVRPRLLVTVGVRGALDLLEAIEGNPLVCAIGCDPGDPIGKRAAYLVAGEVKEAVQSVLDAL